MHVLEIQKVEARTVGVVYVRMGEREEASVTGVC